MRIATLLPVTALMGVLLAPGLHAEELGTEEKIQETYELYRAGETVTLDQAEWLLGLDTTYTLDDESLPGLLQSSRVLAVTPSLAYGFGNGFELSTSVPFLFSESSVETTEEAFSEENTFATGNVSIGGAYTLPLNLPFATSLRASVQLPTATDDRFDTGLVTGFGINVDKIIQPAFVYGGVTISQAWEEDATDFGYQAGLGFYLNHALAAGVELSGTHQLEAPRATNPDSVMLTGRITYQTSQRFGIGPSVGVGVTEGAPDAVLGFKVWRRF